MQKQNTKKQNQIHHALLRAAERFGLTLHRKDLDDIRGMICKNKATFVGRTSLRVSVWDVTVREIACRVVYDRNRKTIVTFLNPNSSQGNYEPPTIEVGIPCGFDLAEIYPGVTGYAVSQGEEIWIPLINGDGTGKVGEFLDALSPRCLVVNVCSPKLRGMLERRGWTVSIDKEGVDLWRKKGAISNEPSGTLGMT